MTPDFLSGMGKDSAFNSNLVQLEKMNEWAT
jgi:hypothetical protein